MQFDHDKFYHSLSNCQPHHTVQILVASQCDDTHDDNNAQHGALYNSTEPSTLPLPGRSQRVTAYLSTINVHNARPIDSAHFVQPMSYNK